MKTIEPITGDTAAEDTVFRRIAEGLTPLPPPAPRLRERLAARVTESAARQRGITTTRLADARWQGVAKGVRAWVLHDNGHSRSAIVQFRPGARIPGHRHATHEECVVLSGSLEAGDCRIGKHDYHLAPAGSRHPDICSREGGVAFLRGTSVGSRSGMLREYLAGWLPGQGGATTTVTAQSGEWREIARGAAVKTLWHAGNEASILLRIAQGAHVAAISMTQGKECLLLEGEAFFGDVLLREGEFQYAPAGTTAMEAFSDTGALCFVHGEAGALLPA